MPTTPTSILNRIMGVEAFTDALSLPTGTTLAAGSIFGGPPSLQVTSATTQLTMTFAAHAGKIISLNRITGVAVTLPAATGSGAIYQIFNTVALSGGSHTFARANATDVMIGIATIGKASGASSNFATTNATTITLNGSTLGGVLGGDTIWLYDNAVNQFLVELVLWGSSTLATPFT